MYEEKGKAVSLQAWVVRFNLKLFFSWPSSKEPSNGIYNASVDRILSITALNCCHHNSWVEMAAVSCRLQLKLIRYSFLLNIEKVKDVGISSH